MTVDDTPAWAAFSRIKDQPDNVAMQAAKGDLDEQRHHAVALDEPALDLSCGVDLSNGDLVVKVAPPSSDRPGREIRLSRSVVERAVQAKIDPLTLVACRMIASAPPGDTWRPKLVGGTTPPTGPALDKLLSVHRTTEADHEIEQALREGRDVILMGDYGAGKTAIATLHTRRCVGEGYGDIWLDLTDAADGPESILARLLVSRRHDKYLVFVDSVQANPPAFEAVLQCVQDLRTEFGLTVQILATAWPRLVQSWREPFKEFRKVSARTDEMIRSLIAESNVPAAQRPAILRLVGRDVHLALDAADFWTQHGRVPTTADLQSAYAEGVGDDGYRHALYWFASLGFFGLDSTAHAANALLPSGAVEWLVERGLIAHSDGRYSIPSHARARLALRQALTKWDARARWGAPEQLAWEHMKRGGERVIRATLSRLDLVGVTGDAAAPFNASTRYLARAWDMFEELSRALARRCSDETWNDNVPAAIFAARALVVMDHVRVWEQVAAFVRRRWTYHVGGVLPEPVGAPSSESADFAQILNAMRQEDKDAPDAPHVVADAADTIDMKRFYHVWTLGTLLGFEGTALQSDPARLEALLTTAEKEIDAAGYFYPRRVPWVTARIVLGLCMAGESYDSSEVVRLACDWLRLPVSKGGPFNNGWQSGTGSWNTPEETTAMCVTALLRAGAPAASEVEAALLWLQTQEEEWTKPGREIDLALVLEAMLLGDDHTKVYHRVLNLLAWAQNELKQSTPSGNDPEAGLRTPFVAAQLAAFVWATVIREYKALLRDMINLEPEELDPATPQIPAQASSPENATSAPLDGVAPRPSLDAWQRAAAQLEQRLLSHLESRDNLVRNTPHGGTPEVHREIKRFQGMLASTRRLRELVTERTTPATLVELDRMGREICGLAWPRLEVPPVDEGGAG